MKKLMASICAVLCISLAGSGQQKATVKEYIKIFKTYPFSDPDPIPEFGKLYPYFRFDGYTNQAIEKKWKVIELENDYIKATILPEIGGKIWTAIEKSTGKAFIYNNEVVKFRDIALRGPWTSGGIEANYGIMGHAAHVSAPVDYTLIHKNDGSASCVIGNLDLLSRSAWRLDINLPKDKAYFTTSSFWYNLTATAQPYYSWMTAGIKADGNLQFVFPGTQYLGHSGEHNDWPIDKKNGRDISFYKNNDFGSFKSYHVAGKANDFFAGYWHDEDFGMGRYSGRGEKNGQKIWIWGLSPQGMIWEKLLTDTNGQYVEVQSGRLFIQEDEKSTFSPFKHKGFAPFLTDQWSETWFPIVKTKGVVAANNYGALNVKQEDGWLKVFFSPLQPVQDELKIKVNDEVVYSRTLRLNTLQLFKDSVRLTTAHGQIVAILGAHKLSYHASPESGKLNRPMDMPADFDWKSGYGLYLLGKEQYKQRLYTAAEENIRASLEKEPHYMPALTELAMLLYRRMQYTEALSQVKRALAIDTYDDAANYYYGLINLKLGMNADAIDGLTIAAMGVEYRSAAYTLLAGHYLKMKALEKCIAYAIKSIDYNRYAMDAYQQLAVCYRLLDKKKEAENVLDTLLTYDPLNHFARFERYLLRGSLAVQHQFTTLISNELPQESFLELAIWYDHKGLKLEANQVLELAPAHTIVSYWKAALQNKGVPDADLSLDLVFPFRTETAEILEQLILKNGQWQLKYHLALIHWHLNNMERVTALFDQIADVPKYAPYYAARAKLPKKNSAAMLADLQKAAALDPHNWRYRESLIQYYISAEAPVKALQLADAAYKDFSGNYLIGTIKAKVLVLNGKYAEAKKLLKSLVVLPSEGGTSGRELYKETLLKLALEEMNKKNYRKALNEISAARIWPENLGVGKPYETEVDERLEDWMAYRNFMLLGETTAAQQMLDKILAFDVFQNNGKIQNSAANLISAWALKQKGKAIEAEDLLQKWLNQEPGNELSAWVFQAYKAGKSTEMGKYSRDLNYKILLQIIAMRL
ncbi:DUF5107 domain-containing protein [Pedobacter heparinus]|uniref:DUF5107 domain-containing protein n=1 Tax=Pedobacter heparinus TaxID=984 RepID=UPI00292F3D78|nr:DUF5107 domain-containing protein [Pedobacter heparinus]